MAEYRIVLAGGGTGGHLFPCLALADCFRSKFPESEIVFVGTRRGIEARIIPESPYPLLLLPVRGLLRKLTLQNALFPFRLLISILKCSFFFMKFKPDLVIGCGGYVSGPALTAAGLLNIKRVIQEQNSYPGLVNRRLANKVDAAFLTFEASKKFFSQQKNVFIYGNPMRQPDLPEDKKYIWKKYGLDETRKTLLIFGGSQGARGMNEVVGAALSSLLDIEGIQIVWLVGPNWLETWKEKESLAPDRLKIMGFVENMFELYSITALALCRAGATTISELATQNIPAIYVPLPSATADHQTENAKAIVQLGGGELIPESQLTPVRLQEQVDTLINDSSRLSTMGRAAGELSMKNAAENIVNECVRIMNRSGSQAGQPAGSEL